MDGPKNLKQPLLSSTTREPSSPSYIPVAWQNRADLWDDSPESLNDETVECEEKSSTSSYTALPEKKQEPQSWFSCASSFFWCCFPIPETKPNVDNSPSDEFSYPR